MSPGDANDLFREAEDSLRELRPADALELFSRAQDAGYDADACAGERWKCHMLRGDFARAWLESDAIVLRDKPDRNRFWDGQPFHGKSVLIRCLHGLGDTLQFIRYTKLLRSRASCVTIESQPALKELLLQSNLADRVITWGEQEPAWDQQIEVMELPRVFRTEESDIPRDIPYLFAPPFPTIIKPTIIRQDKPRIGLVWSASTYDLSRSIPVDELQDLLRVAGVSFLNLQAGPERFDLNSVHDGIPVLYDEGPTVSATASMLRALDLVVTVDSMVAHLAGALGCPVWTLLPYRCDWRWMLRREDSPWYPTMRLFRQSEPGNWVSVIQRVRTCLVKDLVEIADQRRMVSK